MKKLLFLAAALCLALSLSTCAHFTEPEPDYTEMMLEAAQAGDVDTGRQAETLYRIQAEKNGGAEPCVSFDELYLLARAIHFEYGNYRYSDELRMCAGEVLLNRVASPEYPDSLEAVIYQSGEDGLDRESFENCVCPSRASVEAAYRLLTGQRMLEPEVVLESHKPAKNVYAMFCDDLLGNTYFFKSENPELYVHTDNNEET